MLPVESPIKTYTGLDGKPLANGFVFFGVPNLNPITSPVTVYWDAAGTQPAAQPLRTINGYIVRAGVPANVFCDGAYSELVQDSKHRQVFYARSSDEFSVSGILQLLIENLASPAGASNVNWKRTAVNAVTSSLGKRLDWNPIMPFEFMNAAQIADVQSGALTIDMTVYVQRAIDAVVARNGKGLMFLNSGKYKITSALDIPYGVSIGGEGATASELVCYNCNGLNFTSYGYEIGSMYFSDFGITSGAGVNYTGAATLSNASTMDGLYFDRMRFYGWNECFNLAANWNCTISNCVGQNINVGVAASGVLVALRIINNRFTFASGGNGVASTRGIDIRGGSIQESIHITQNQLYGFDIAINSPAVAVFINIIDNDISAKITGIAYTTVNGVLNITHNYIETFGVGIMGAGQSVPTPTTQTNIEFNSFIGVSGATIGLQLNAAGNTYQFNTSIAKNNFSGFTVHDMKLFAPGKTSIDRNRCMSAVPTNSIWIGGVIAGPVEVRKNWCNKAVYSDVPTDIASGLLVLDGNTEANTFVPSRGTFTPSFIPTLGAFGSTAYSSASGSFERIGNLCFFSLLLVESAHAIGTASGEVRVTGLPFTSSLIAQATGVSIGDASGWGGSTPNHAEVIANSKSIILNTRATANGPSVNSPVTDMATGSGSLNRVTISGVYLCA